MFIIENNKIDFKIFSFSSILPILFQKRVNYHFLFIYFFCFS